jgi:hypothetical protein
MAQGLRDLIAEVEEERKQVSKGQSVQVRSQNERKSLRHIVDFYFRDVRPSFLSHASSSDSIEEIDSEMQDLLECSHKQTMRSVLKKKLSSIRKKLIQLDGYSLVLTRTDSSTATDSIDMRIIETLQRLVPSARLSYEQAILDLVGPERKSYRGPATDLREALRETLDHLAPDKDITSQPGFKFEGDTKCPTMRQKVRFVLCKRGISKTLSETPEKAVDSVEATIGSFIRSVYNRSCVSTHTPTDRNEVLRVRDWVRIVLCELLEIR